LNKTQVIVYFSLYGDDFPIAEVTEKLKVTPTETYKKGDLITNRSTVRYRKETSWDLGTGYQDSLDVNNQLQQIVGKLKNMPSTINEIKESYSLECKFFIVIKIEKGNAPALYIDKEIIKFASSIEAEFDVDLYANPYERDFDE
jgi:membrane-associated HD superfamily phosphohydrolase